MTSMDFNLEPLHTVQLFVLHNKIKRQMLCNNYYVTTTIKGCDISTCGSITFVLIDSPSLFCPENDSTDSIPNNIS